MIVSYDSRFVPAHDMALHGQVLLINEAPGPDEAASGIPLYGQQGANLFHALRAAGIAWAAEYGKLTWPTNDRTLDDERQRQKKSFLATRAKYITCTNAFPYWPKPKNSTNNFCPPRKKDVCGIENIERIKGEILTTHSTLLICGRYAYIACTGEELFHPAKREYAELTEKEIADINMRLNSRFKQGWYMGHTRRWPINKKRSAHSLRVLAKSLNWPLSEQIT